MRRLAIAMVAAAQVAIVAAVPFADAPPAPAGHFEHIAADTVPGCHPFHDELCVVCRVLSTEALAATGLAPLAPCPPVLSSASFAATASPHPAGPFGRHQARAPPIA